MLNNNSNDAVFSNSRAQIKIQLTSIMQLRQSDCKINVKVNAKSGNGYSIVLGKDTWIITHRILLGPEL
jgi:hypothetical protein